MDNLIPWRRLIERALQETLDDLTARHVQLAMVGLDRRPTNRTVVFRGFVAGTDWLTFITDGRSQKARHVQRQSAGEVCWYLRRSRQQFRLAGELVLVAEGDPNQALRQARELAWATLSAKTRSQFLWP